MSSVVERIPSGRKICWSSARAYACVSGRRGSTTRVIAKPPAATSKFEYWNVSPKSVVGDIVPSKFSQLCGELSANSKMNSRSRRGSPVQAQSVCAIVTCGVTAGSAKWNSESSSTTGWSQRSRPADTSFAASSEVSAFVVDPIMKSVRPVTGAASFCARSPNPRESSTPSELTSTTAAPGTPAATRASSMRSSSRAIAAASSGRRSSSIQDSSAIPGMLSEPTTPLSCAPRRPSASVVPSMSASIIRWSFWCTTPTSARSSVGVVMNTTCAIPSQPRATVTGIACVTERSNDGSTVRHAACIAPTTASPSPKSAGAGRSRNTIRRSSSGDCTWSTAPPCVVATHQPAGTVTSASPANPACASASS